LGDLLAKFKSPLGGMTQNRPAMSFAEMSVHRSLRSPDHPAGLFLVSLQSVAQSAYIGLEGELERFLTPFLAQLDHKARRQKRGVA
jgi:hypothetical protein